MSNQRKARVASSLRTSLAELIRGLSDPRIGAAGLVSINHVELNRDMAIANVYVSFIGGEEARAGAAVAALTQATGRLRGPLGRSLNLKRCPELRFFLDESLEFRERLAEIIDNDESNATEPPSDPMANPTEMDTD